MKEKSSEKKDVKVAFNTTYTDARGQGGITVVSKRKMADTPENYAILREKFNKIEEARLAMERGETTPEEQIKQHLLEETMEKKPEEKPEQKRIVLITHLNVFLYATCYWVQSGTLPYLTKSLGADPVMFGQLQTVFSLSQLVGGPIYGRLGDMWGERTALILAFTASVLTYVLTALSTSLPLLFLSRLPSVFLHVMQGSQMVVTSLSSPQSRAAALARLGFSYGIGMVVGPSLGGFVTAHLGEHASAWMAAAGSCVSLALVIYYVPEIPKQQQSESNGSVLNVKQILSLITVPRAGSLLLLKTVCGIPIGILQSMFSVIAMEQFQLPADQNGLLLSYIGGLSMMMQGVGISACTSRFSDRMLLQFSAFSLVISFFCLSLLTSIYDFLLLQVPMVCSLSLINSILQSSLTKSVPQTQTGAILGLNMAVNSTIRTLAPTIGGAMMTMYGYSSIGNLGSICNLVVLFLIKSLDIY